MTGHRKPRLLLLNFFLGITCLEGSFAFGGDNNKDFRKQLQKNLEVRLGLREATADKGIKVSQQPVFIVQKPGLVGIVSGTASLGDEIAFALQGATNVIVNDSLARTPKKSDYVFPVGEQVRIHSVSVSKDMRSVRFDLTAIQTDGFKSSDGSDLRANPNAYVALVVPEDWLAQQDYPSILNAIFRWAAPQNPSSLSPTENDSHSGAVSRTASESGGQSPSSTGDGRGTEEASKGLLGEGVIVVYNVRGMSELKLAPETLAGIFLGKIVSWDDPAITRNNGLYNLSSHTIIVVHRADNSDATLAFTDYLSKVSSEWQNGPGKGTSVKWPFGLGSKGNEGMAQTIRQLDGSIGYLELNDATSTNISVAKLISTNASDERSETASTATSVPVPGSDEKPSVELQEGQTPQEVEQLLGMPSDTLTLKGSLVYVYPTVKVIFENGKLVDVEYAQK